MTDFIDFVLSKSATIPESGCWIWLGKTALPDGYALRYMRRNGKETCRPLHREMWEHVNGPIPKGLLICHKCDTRPCVNPDHLYAGTDLDNARDREARNRRGDHSKKLTFAIAQSIRSSSKSNKGLAKEYGVSPKTIRNVRMGRTWIKE